MISKSFIALLILALTSSVNAAAIAPRQPLGGDGGSDIGPPDCQFLLGLVVRAWRRTLLTSDLGLARDGVPQPRLISGRTPQDSSPILGRVDSPPSGFTTARDGEVFPIFVTLPVFTPTSTPSNTPSATTTAVELNSSGE
jgi:hypothetical protein